MKSRLEPWQSNLAALFLSQTVTMVAFAFVFPFIPLYVQHLGVKGTAEAAQWAAAIVAASALGMAVAQPIWGHLADRFGRRPMVIRSVLAGGITTALMGLATSPEQLLVIRLFQGILTGTVAASSALVATSTPRQHLGFALGLMQVAMFTGTSIGPLIGGLVADTLGFRPAFYAAGALMIVSTAVVVMFVHEDFRPAPPGTPRPGMIAETRALLGLAAFPILLGVTYLIQFGGTVVSPVLSLYVAELQGGESVATAAGIVLAGTGVMSAISAVALGRLGDRIGPGVILPICLLGAAVTYFPQAIVQQVWQLFVLRLFLGIFVGGLMPSANALLAGLVPRQQRGAVFGLSAAATGLANATAPLTGALITTHFGLRAVMLATGVLFALASGWVMMGFRRQPIALGRTQAPAVTVRRLAPEGGTARSGASTLPREGDAPRSGTPMLPLEAAGIDSPANGSAPRAAQSEASREATAD